MMIDRIGSINPVASGNKYGGNNQINQTVHTDSISLSQEALEKSALYRAQELVVSAPEVRLDRIAELKQKIADPSYINDAVVQTTADHMIDMLGL